jgi:peroxiredoxin
MIKTGLKKIFFSIALVMLSLTTVYSEEIEVNARAPEFNLMDLEGNDVFLKDYSGKAIALFFWATWCPYCQKETPRLVKLKQEFGDRLEILAINYKEGITRIENFALKHKINYKILLDKKGEVFRLYNILGVPGVIILDKQGFIQFIGSELPKDYREFFKKLSV